MEMDFNRGWLFALDGLSGVKINEKADFDDSFMRKLDLPHDWQIENQKTRDADDGGSQGYYPRKQTGWYRKRFFAPESFAGKTVRLIFDGVQRFSTVYLNGEQVGGHRYGYVPFDCDLTGRLDIGRENVISVKVDNSESEPDRWYSGAGIYRGVTLKISEKLCILPDGATLTPKLENGVWSCGVKLRAENRTGKEIRGKVRLTLSERGNTPSKLLEQEETLDFAEGAREYSFSVPAGEPKLWDTEAPVLYDAEIDLVADGKITDSVMTTTGFRTAVFDDDRGFLLNGRQLKLYGGDFHHDGGAFGAAVPLKVWRRRLEKLKAIGGNAVRCSHNPQCAGFYGLCDELGILVIDELYDKWTELYYKKLFDTDRFDDLAAMLHRDVNHPSVVLWSVGNELGIQYSEQYFGYLDGLCRACRKLDPSRGVSCALIGFCIGGYDDGAPLEKKLEAAKRYGEIVDVFMGNYMENYYEAMREYGMKRAVIGSEVFTYYRHEQLSTSKIVARSPWLDVKAHDWVAGGFVWSACDYLGESAVGWPCYGWTGAPIDSAGFIKHRGYYLQSMWSESPMVYITLSDEREKWDMAHAQWGFPQTTAFWHGLGNSRVICVGVYTNCEKVGLYYGSSVPQIAVPSPDDQIARFYVPFRGGSLRAVGYRGDGQVCEQTLTDCAQSPELRLELCDPTLTADGADIAQLEATLCDRLGQRLELDCRKVRFTVSGEGSLLLTDNGDLTDPYRDRSSAECQLYGGRALCVIRSTEKSGKITVTVEAEGVESRSVELESAKQ